MVRFSLLCLLTLPVAASADHASDMLASAELFTKQIRPLFLKHCLECHGGGKVEGELEIVDRAQLLKGGSAGPAIVPGDSKKSLLYRMVAHTRKPAMPYEASALPADAVAQIARWIDLGAAYDKPLIEPKNSLAWTQKVVPPEAKKHWAYQPIRRPEVPAGPPKLGDIDRFINAKLRTAGYTLNTPASRAQLLRRMSFDVVGLPPTPAEIDDFVSDGSANALEKQVDRLLASPHFGERQARHWLDLVRYAESHGFEHDYDRPTAYPYRDYVIRSFNEDLPFDRFLRQQLAGDEIEPGNISALTATGFLAAGVHSTQITINEVEKHRYDELDDIVATIGTSMLGLTIGCARCHDHKYDAFPQADYYRMVSVFTKTIRTEMAIPIDPAADAKAKAAFNREHAPIAEALANYDRDVKRFGWIIENDPIRKMLADAVDVSLRSQPKPRNIEMLACSEGVKPIRLHSQGADFLSETHYLRRGDVSQKEAIAPASYLQVLMDAPMGDRWKRSIPEGSKLSYRRSALADWMTDVEHGAGKLVARVIVNRLWQRHFGRGIVATPSDFGVRGEAPSHPELLEYLADELIRGGWKLKPLHKRMLMSVTYGQSATLTDDRAQRDPENKLFGRAPIRRLEAEIIRDTMLFVSGTLDEKMYGPGTLDPASKRRSIYFTVKRSKPIPSMIVFDAPDGTVPLAERPATTIAPQALALMNHPQVRASAKAFAATLESLPMEERLVEAYRRTLGRRPTADERTTAMTYLQSKPFADFAQVLFLLNELIYVE